MKKIERIERKKKKAKKQKLEVNLEQPENLCFDYHYTGLETSSITRLIWFNSSRSTKVMKKITEEKKFSE